MSEQRVLSVYLSEGAWEVSEVVKDDYQRPNVGEMVHWNEVERPWNTWPAIVLAVNRDGTLDIEPRGGHSRPGIQRNVPWHDVFDVSAGRPGRGVAFFPPPAGV